MNRLSHELACAPKSIAPPPFGLSVSRIFCWTPEVWAFLMPKRAPKGRISTMALSKLARSPLGHRERVSECGSLLPLFPPLTRQRRVMRRDESRRAKAVTSRRTPEFRFL